MMLSFDETSVRRSGRSVEPVRGQPDRAGCFADSDVSSAPAVTIPGVTLTRELRRGGQGIVYAGQQERTGRSVAVKVIRGGALAGPLDRARFQREIRVLARIQHPYIVSVIDGGVASNGYYFVMDLVDGLPVTEYIAAHALSTREILRLFVTICEGISAAHVRGVIHRDLKPSNILVDAAGRPNILDFGLAKVIHADDEDTAADQTITESGHFLGSLRWAPPEQAAGRGELIDVRSDVYGIGVLLFHALTGKFPYAVTGATGTVCETIQHTRPTRPSQLNSRLDDDVDTIVLQCLQKERARRYQSADALAHDLEHYLAHQPIEAKRDSTVYVLRKTLWRHRYLAGATAACLVILSVFSVAMSILYTRALRAEQLAANRLVDVSSARDEAVAAKEQLEAQVAVSTTIRDFLINLFQSADPHQAAGAVTVRDILDQGRAEIESDLDDQPATKATLLLTMATAYGGMGYVADAISLAKQAVQLRSELFGRNSQETAEAVHRLARLQHAHGNYEVAEPLFLEAIEVLAEQPPGFDLRRAQASYASFLQDLGRLEEASDLFGMLLDDTTSYPADATTQLAMLSAFAIGLTGQADYAGAERCLRRALALSSQLNGPDHVTTARYKLRLALILLRQGEKAEAEALTKDALDCFLLVLEPASPEILDARRGLAAIAHRRGENAEAERLLVSVVEDTRSKFGDSHIKTAVVLADLGSFRHKCGDLAGAEAAVREHLSVQRRIAPDHPRVASSLRRLGNIYMEQNELTLAAEVLAEAWEHCRHRGASAREYVNVAEVASDFGECLFRLGRHDEAEDMLLAGYETAVRFRDELEGPAHEKYDATARLTAGRLMTFYHATERPELAAEYAE